MDKIPELHPVPMHPRTSFLYQYLAAVTGTLAVVTSAMHFGWPSPSLPQLLKVDSPIPITSSDGSWLAVMPCIGAVPGAFLGGYTSDTIGRKASMMIVSPFYFIAWLAIAFAPNVLVLNIARFVVGIMDGITFTAFPMYMGEISDRKIRGLLGCSISVTFVFGFLLINVLGLYCSIKTTALIASIVPVIHFVTFIWMPESPYFYLVKHKDQKVANTLKKFTGTASVTEIVKALRAEVAGEDEGSTRYLHLFTEKSNRKALAIVLGLRLIQQFSGCYTITFYCLIIFNEAGGSISGETGTLLYFTVQLLGSIVSSFLVDKTGRRPLLIISIIGSGLALTAQGIYLYLKDETEVDISMWGFVPLAALLMYVVLFSIGLSTIPVLVISEFFPTDVKALAVCLVDIFYGVVIVISSKFFQIMKDEFGMFVPFFAFAGCCVFGLIFIVICVPETKGKTLEEIQKELRGGEKLPTHMIELKSASEYLLTNNINHEKVNV